MTQMEKGSPYVSRDEVENDLGNKECKHRPPAMSVFDGNKVIVDAQNDFISALLKVIKGNLSRSDVDFESSLTDEIQVIIKEIDCKDVDVSHSKKFIELFH